MVKPVLLVRSDNNEADALALSNLGIQTLIDPYTEISAAKDESDAIDLLSDLRTAKSPLWLIVTSLNSLRCWAEIVGDDELRSVVSGRADIDFAAIGEATAQALRSYGAQKVFIPSEARAEVLARELVGTYPTARAIIPGGNLAMPQLPAILTQSGWEVRSAEVYTTSRVENEPESVRLIREGRLSAILLRSPSAVRALTHFVPRPQVPLVCAGATTALAVEALGLKVDALSPKTAPEVVASTIRSLLFQETSREIERETGRAHGDN